MRVISEEFHWAPVLKTNKMPFIVWHRGLAGYSTSMGGVSVPARVVPSAPAAHPIAAIHHPLSQLPSKIFVREELLPLHRAHREVSNGEGFLRLLPHKENLLEQGPVFPPGIPLQFSLFAEGSRMVYVTPKGAKYHLADCRTLKKSKDVAAITIKEAKARRYDPCKVCRPGSEG